MSGSRPNCSLSEFSLFRYTGVEAEVVREVAGWYTSAGEFRRRSRSAVRVRTQVAVGRMDRSPVVVIFANSN